MTQMGILFAQKRTEVVIMLPKINPEKLPGTVCEQYLRCGKPNCKCAKGELHGPYWYRFWREGRRLHKQYVRKADLEAVRAACAAWRAEVSEARALLARGPALISWYLRGADEEPETDEDWELWVAGPQDVRQLLDLATQRELPARFSIRAFGVLLEMYQRNLDEEHAARNLEALGWRKHSNQTLDDDDP